MDQIAHYIHRVQTACTTVLDSRRVRFIPRLERIIREMMRRVVGAFPEGHSMLMLAAARLRHIAST
jgi:hypothetical protein